MFETLKVLYISYDRGVFVFKEIVFEPSRHFVISDFEDIVGLVGTNLAPIECWETDAKQIRRTEFAESREVVCGSLKEL